jgi:enterochelin esterase family protein
MNAPQRRIMKRTFFLLVLQPLAILAPAQTPPPLNSPEVHSYNRVTFRFRGPNVREVVAIIEGASKPLPMQKDDHGVWNATTDPLLPDFYGYTLIADGVALFDPSNYATKPAKSMSPAPGLFPGKLPTCPWRDSPSFL